MLWIISAQYPGDGPVLTSQRSPTALLSLSERASGWTKGDIRYSQCSMKQRPVRYTDDSGIAYIAYILPQHPRSTGNVLIVRWPSVNQTPLFPLGQVPHRSIRNHSVAYSSILFNHYPMMLLLISRQQFASQYFWFIASEFFKMKEQQITEYYLPEIYPK